MVTTITKLIADLYHHGLMCMFVQSKKGVGVCGFVSVCRKSKRGGGKGALLHFQQSS